MSYVRRAVTEPIRRALRTFPAVLVTGARQSGKTTLLRHEFGATHRYVSLDRPDVRARALADPVGFLADHPPPAALDEVQRTPELLQYLKQIIDEDRHPGQWLLSGSQIFPLMQGIGQTLAGRVAVMVLDPLSVAESIGGPTPVSVDNRIESAFAAAPQRQPRAALRSAIPDLGDWLLRGGYPEPRLNRDVDRQLWFGGYVQTYLERDVRDLVQVGDLNAFHRFLVLAAARSGCVLNMADLARDCGVAGPTVKRWLSVLEASHVVHLLPPFHRNFGKRITKSPKLYFLDTGLVTYLTGLHTAEAVINGPSIGALAETAVVAEWVKAFRQNGEVPALSYWRSSSGLEVDLVMERNNMLFGIEVKATATPTPHHADSLARWLELVGDRARGVLACRVEAPTALRPSIRAVPWHLGWCA